MSEKYMGQGCCQTPSPPTATQRVGTPPAAARGENFYVANALYCMPNPIGSRWEKGNWPSTVHIRKYVSQHPSLCIQLPANELKAVSVGRLRAVGQGSRACFQVIDELPPFGQAECVAELRAGLDAGDNERAMTGHNFAD